MGVRHISDYMIHKNIYKKANIPSKIALCIKSSIKKYPLQFSVVILFVLSIFQSIWFFKNGLYDFVDGGFSNYVALHLIYSQFFSWNSYNYTGLMNTMPSIIGLFFSFLQYLFVSLLGYIYGAEIFYGIIIFIGSISTFMLVKELLPKNDKLNIYLSFAAAILFSMFISQPNGISYETTGVFLPFTILFVYKLYLNLGATKKIRWKYLALSAIGFSALLSFGESSYAIQNATVIAVILLIIILALKQNRTRFALYSFEIIILAIITNASWIITTYLFTKAEYSNFFNQSSRWIIQNLDKQNIFSGLQLVNLNIYYNVYELLFFTIVMFSIFYIIKEKKKSSIFLIALISSLAVTLFYYLNFNPPFGIFFNFLINYFSELLVFRYSGSSLYYIIYLIYAVLFSVGSWYLLNRFSKERIIKYAITITIFTVIILHIYYYDYLSNTTNISINAIPNHVYKIANYINNASGNFNVAAIPAESPFDHQSIWYSGTDIYTYLVKHAVFTGGYNSQGELFFPITQSEYFNIARNMQNNIIENNTKTARALGMLGVKYIIVQGDTIHNGYESFNLSYLYNNLNKSKAFKYDVKYSNSSVYTNNYYVPFVYTAGLYNNTPNVPLQALFLYSNLSNVNTIIYTNTYSLGLNNITPTLTTTFKNPNIKFINENPTYISVNISNATTPFYLVLRNTYDNNWQAMYSNGSIIAATNHIMVNGYANAWYVNKKGNFKLILYYALQPLADISIAISVFGIILILIIAFNSTNVF